LGVVRLSTGEIRFTTKAQQIRVGQPNRARTVESLAIFEVGPQNNNSELLKARPERQQPRPGAITKPRPTVRYGRDIASRFSQ